MFPLGTEIGTLVLSGPLLPKPEARLKNALNSVLKQDLLCPQSFSGHKIRLPFSAAFLSPLHSTHKPPCEVVHYGASPPLRYWVQPFPILHSSNSLRKEKGRHATQRSCSYFLWKISSSQQGRKDVPEASLATCCSAGVSPPPPPKAPIKGEDALLLTECIYLPCPKPPTPVAL